MLCFLLILLPLGMATLIPFSPMASGYQSAAQKMKAAFFAGNKTKELENLRLVLDFTPWRGELWQRAGRLYMDRGEYQQAVDSFKQAQNLKQLDVQGKVWLADSLLTLEDKNGAKQILRGLSEEKDVFILMQIAALQRRLNDTFGALSTLLNAYPMDPTNRELNYQLGLQLAAQEPESAVSYLKTASFDPQHQAGAQALLDVLSQTSEIAGTPEQFLYIGQILSKMEEWDVAARAFQRAVDLNPENANALALLGEAQQQMGEDGYPTLKKALALDPESETVNGITALYYRRQGKPDVALIYLERALSANPSAAVWEIETGNTLADMGDLEKALTHYQKAVQIDSTDWTSWRALAMFSVSRNYEVNPVGIDAARQAMLLHPDSPPLLDLMGTALMLLGDLDSAERYFYQADELDPNQAAVLIHLGQLYIYKGEKETAFAYFRRAEEAAEESRLRDMAHRLLIENGGE